MLLHIKTAAVSVGQEEDRQAVSDGRGHLYTLSLSLFLASYSSHEICIKYAKKILIVHKNVPEVGINSSDQC